MIEHELNRAEALHPDWPVDYFQQLSIIGEELGEVNKALNDYWFKGNPLEPVATELVQTAAMCLRMLTNL